MSNVKNEKLLKTFIKLDQDLEILEIRDSNPLCKSYPILDQFKYKTSTSNFFSISLNSIGFFHLALFGYLFLLEKSLVQVTCVSSNGSWLLSQSNASKRTEKQKN